MHQVEYIFDDHLLHLDELLILVLLYEATSIADFISDEVIEEPHRSRRAVKALLLKYGIELVLLAREVEAVLVKLIIEGEPLVLDYRVLSELLYLLEKLTHSVVLTEVAHDGVISRKVWTTSVHHVLEELHHLLDIFLATLIVLKGLEFLLC